MRIACRVVAIAALIGILAIFVLIQQYSNLMNNAIDVSGDAQSAFPLFSPLFAFMATTTFALSFASGVVGMVMAGQRRQPIWFTILLAAVLVGTYASIAIVMIPSLAQFLFAAGPVQDLSGSVNDPLLRLEMLNYVIAPLFAPLAALVYSLRAQRRVQPPASIATQGEGAGLSGLEYSKLDDGPAG